MPQQAWRRYSVTSSCSSAAKAGASRLPGRPWSMPNIYWHLTVIAMYSSLEVRRHPCHYLFAQQGDSKSIPHTVIVCYCAMTSVASQVAEEARPHAARLSQAAASGTVAVFQCFAAQAHAALVGLMHVRCRTPSPHPPSRPTQLQRCRGCWQQSIPCACSHFRAAQSPVVEQQPVFSSQRCCLACFAGSSKRAAAELRSFSYCSILLLPADLTGVQQPPPTAARAGDAHAAAPSQRPHPDAGAAGFPIAEDIDRGGVGGASPPKRQSSAASSAASAGSGGGGRRTVAGGQGSAGRPPPVPGGTDTQPFLPFCMLGAMRELASCWRFRGRPHVCCRIMRSACMWPSCGRRQLHMGVARRKAVAFDHHAERNRNLALLCTQGRPSKARPQSERGGRPLRRSTRPATPRTGSKAAASSNSRMRCVDPLLWGPTRWHALMSTVRALA